MNEFQPCADNLGMPAIQDCKPEAREPLTSVSADLIAAKRQRELRPTQSDRSVGLWPLAARCLGISARTPTSRTVSVRGSQSVASASVPGVVELEIADDICPAWVAPETRLRVPVPPTRSVDLGDHDVLAWGVWNDGRRSPILAQTGAGLETAFPWETWTEYILTESYASWRRRPLYTRLPVSYRVLPSGLRYRLAMRMCRSRRAEEQSFPTPLFEGGFEALRHVWRSVTDPLAGAPASRLCLTHDVDSEEGFRFVKDLAGVELSLGLRSSWNIVVAEYPVDASIVHWLMDHGFEIGLHDYVHDNKLIYLSECALRRRLDRCLGFIERWNVAGFRSPSWFRSPRLLRVLRDYVQYDCSCLDFDWLCPAGRGGVLTATPFVHHGIVEIPTTLPFEAPLLESCDPALVPAYWRPKVDWLVAVGGQIVVNTHPDPEYSGNLDMIRSYGRFLEEALESCNGRWSLPRALAAEVRPRV